jgi:hypothetical protein
LTAGRFIDCEKWRAEYAGVGVEELVRTFDYKEKAEVFKYYPQYYHKTDKVKLAFPTALSLPRCSLLTLLPSNRTVALFTSSNSAT